MGCGVGGGGLGRCWGGLDRELGGGGWGEVGGGGARSRIGPRRRWGGRSSGRWVSGGGIGPRRVSGGGRSGRGGLSRGSWRLSARGCLRWSSRDWVRAGLEQISARLKLDHPDDRGMRISHETIYRALYVQSRGELRRQLTVLSLERRRDTSRAGVVGSAGGTFRTWSRSLSVRPRSRIVLCPGTGRVTCWSGRATSPSWPRWSSGIPGIGVRGDRRTEHVIGALRDQTHPSHLTRSLTWDQGKERRAQGVHGRAAGVAAHSVRRAKRARRQDQVAARTARRRPRAEKMGGGSWPRLAPSPSARASASPYGLGFPTRSPVPLSSPPARLRDVAMIA